MNPQDAPAYGLWPLVLINAAVFIFFAFSFTKPRTARDWRSFGVFAAFLVALFTEMYGFPLTIFVLSGWLGSSFPGLDLLSHNGGPILQTLIGGKGDPHFSPIHLVSNVFIAGGFILIGAAWDVLYKAQRAYQLATTGPYVPAPSPIRWVRRHYAGLPHPVADDHHANHVPDPGDHVRPAGAARGT